MNLRSVILPAAVVVLADAYVLVGVAGNRAGEPEAAVELTERELKLEPLGEENSGVALSVEWRGPHRRSVDEGGEWFGQAKLRELDFDVRRAPASLLPKEAFVVLEYRARLERAGTRLFAIDAGRDPPVLRRRYPDRTRYMIMRSIVRAMAAQGAPGGVRGAVVEVLPPTVYVPLPFAETLAGLDPKPAEAPRYAVALRVGRNYEPWVSGLRRIQP